MRAPSSSFKNEIAAYRKKWIEDNPNCPPPQDMLAVLDRWEKHIECESIWERVQRRLPVEAMPTAEEFIFLVLFRRSVAKRLDEINRRTPTEAEAKKRGEAHVHDKSGTELVRAHAELAFEYAALADLNTRRARLFTRQTENAERRRFIIDWRDKFTQLCGHPLDDVVRVLAEIVYGGRLKLGVIRAVRRATTRRARKV
jgi:hypothetical protein